MPSITVKITVPAKIVEELKWAYRQVNGRKPSEKWIREFLKEDAEGIFLSIDECSERWEPDVVQDRK